MENQKDSMKNKCLKGLQSSSDLDDIIKKLRETREDRYLTQDFKRKKWMFAKEKAKSFGTLKMLFGMSFSVFLFASTFAFVENLFQSISSLISTDKIVFGVIFLLCSNLITLNFLWNEKVKKKMSDLNEQEYFNLSVFKKESSVFWKALSSLVNVHKEFTYEEAKNLIETNLSSKEYLESSKEWEKERNRLLLSLEKEQEKVQRAENEKMLLFKDTVDLFQNELKELQNQIIFISALLVELKNKTDRHRKGMLSLDDLKFTGNYALYKMNENKLILMKNSGLKRKIVDKIDLENESNHEIALMIKNQNYWSIKNNRLFFLFFKDHKTFAMEIDIDEYYKKLFEKEREYMINLLYDIIDICLDLANDNNKRR